MESQEILKMLLELLAKKYEIPENILKKENLDKPLTGMGFQFDGILMTYLFFDVQKEFKICIDVKNILNYEFNTINGIIKVIEENLKMKS